MPVTTRVAPVDVRIAPQLSTFNSTSLLQQSYPTLWSPEITILDSSFGVDTAVHPTCFETGSGSAGSNGLVGTVLDAYVNHHHLILRPEDVWFGILTQFSFYVNKHSEDLREYFVSHDGKKKLEIEQFEMDLPAFVLQMTGLISQNINDPELKDWIMPDFTTTTDNDRVTASIIMMGTLQKYFAYFLYIGCGIPSVTLLGERSDWEKILDRLKFFTTLPSGHEEVKTWSVVLTTVLKHFVKTFDKPDSPEIVKFWQRSVHQHKDNYSGDKHITGWILAFCFWNTEGEPLAARSALHAQENLAPNWAEKVFTWTGDEWWLEDDRLGRLEWQNIPSASAHVPIHVKDARKSPPETFMAKAIAGSVGWTARDSDVIFNQTRRSGRTSLGSSGETLVEEASMQGASMIRRIAQKILCFNCDKPDAVDKKIDDQDKDDEGQYNPVARPKRMVITEENTAPQFSDLKELNEPWAHEEGGKHDSLQPVTGWWVIRTPDGQYGRDPDVPDVQFDSDADDYDDDLARNGRPLNREL